MPTAHHDPQWKTNYVYFRLRRISQKIIAMFQNLPQVTKNILLLNIAFFVASLLLKSQGIGLEMTLGAHYVNSPFFEPYQVVTHFFMHSTDNFLHIFFNMWLFVMLGAYLENIWGPKDSLSSISLAPWVLLHYIT